MCTQSQKNQFSYFFSYPLSFGSVPFGSACLHWNQMEPSLHWSQKSTDSGSKWNGSNGSSVDERPIRTNFGSVPFATALFGSSVNGILIRK